MINKAYFTTSWDDGSIYDMKLADLLSKYNIAGTFYIPIKNIERNETLSYEQIREIGQMFEIGGHTYSHRVLTAIKDGIAKKEIEDGKKALEDIIGRNVMSFCPPKGKFKRKHIMMIEKAGFLLLRTVGYIRINKVIESIYGSQLHFIHPSLQFYPHKFTTYIISAFKRIDLEGIRNLFLSLNWYKLAILLIKKAEIQGGVFHLIGHSWELEEYNLWGKLKDLLKYIKDRNFCFATNIDILNNANR